MTHTRPLAWSCGALLFLCAAAAPPAWPTAATDGSRAGAETRILAAGEVVVEVERAGGIRTSSTVERGPQAIIVELDSVPLLSSSVRDRAAVALRRKHVERVVLDVTRLAAIVDHRYVRVFSGFSARVPAAALPDIERIPGVRRVWPDGTFHATLADSVRLIRADRVWNELGITGAGTTIAILDTGIDYTHPDLGGCFGPSCKVVGGYDFVNGDDDPQDDNGHGTHVAGIAAANGGARGVAPDARLLALKVLDRFGNGQGSSLIAALEYAVDPDDDPLTADGAQVINLSLAGPGDPDDPVCQAVDGAVAAGVVVVTSAGNGGPDYETIGSPGLARSAITVGAVDKQDGLFFFSSRGPAQRTYQIKPEIVAPGVGITSTVPRGSCERCDASGYRTLSGTSMATPHVAGSAALLLQRFHGTTPAQVRDRLASQSVAVATADLFSRGFGRIDALAAVTATTVLDPAGLGLGLDTVDEASFHRSAVVALTNAAGTTRTYVASVEGDLPAGVAVSLDPQSLTLAPGASGTITFELLAKNSAVPSRTVPPFSYEGAIRIEAATETLRVPFAFLKAPVLTLRFTESACLYVVRNETGFLKIGGGGACSPAAGLFEFPLLVPEGALNVVATFYPLTAFVVREQLKVAGDTFVTLEQKEAVHDVTLAPRDRHGKPLALTRSLALSRFAPAAGGLPVIAGFTRPDSAPHYRFSSMSDAYRFEISLLESPLAPGAPSYVLHGAAHDGIEGPVAFETRPEDLRHVVVRHTPEPGVASVAARPTLSTPPRGGVVFSTAYSCAEPTRALAAPFEEEFYFAPHDDDGPGYIRQVVAAADDACGTVRYLTPYWIARSEEELAAFLPLDSQPVYATAATVVRAGLGPHGWRGRFFNSAGEIHFRGVDGPNWPFLGQLGDLRPHSPLAYQLFAGSQRVAAGALTGVGAPFSSAFPSIAVAPGAYEVRLSLDDYPMGGLTARTFVRAGFDTRREDPNPPRVPFLRLLEGAEPTALVGPFGATVRFRVEDESGIGHVALSYDLGAGPVLLPLTAVEDGTYVATIPPVSAKPRFVPLVLAVEDTAGNTLRVASCSPATGSAEVCFDNCPHVANPGQEDFDGDSIGDLCESDEALADADGSTRVDGFDLARIGRAFGSSCGDAGYDAAVDLDRNCTVDGDDLAIFAPEFGRAVPS